MNITAYHPSVTVTRPDGTSITVELTLQDWQDDQQLKKTVERILRETRNKPTEAHPEINKVQNAQHTNPTETDHRLNVDLTTKTPKITTP